MISGPTVKRYSLALLLCARVAVQVCECKTSCSSHACMACITGWLYLDDRYRGLHSSHAIKGQMKL